MSIIAIILLSIIDYVEYNKWGLKYSNQYFNPYRIFIVIIQFIICLILLMFSWVQVFLFLILWWFGLADFFYYIIDTIFGNEHFFKWNNNTPMCWLCFTPYGLIKLIFKKTITKKEFLIQLIIPILIYCKWIF